MLLLWLEAALLWCLGGNGGSLKTQWAPAITTAVAITTPRFKLHGVLLPGNRGRFPRYFREEEMELLVPRAASREEDALGPRRKYLKALRGECEEPSICDCGLKSCRAVARRRRQLQALAGKLHEWKTQKNPEHWGTKLLLVVRHAQSTANQRLRTLTGVASLAWSNLRKRSWGPVDPALSAKGREQCRAAGADMLYLMELLDSLGSRDFCFQSFMVSPMTRTLQTASLIFGGIGERMRCPSEDSGGTEEGYLPWLVDPLLREKLTNLSDTGTEYGELREQLQQLYLRQTILSGVFDFTAVPPGTRWWLLDSKESLQRLLEDFPAMPMPQGSTSSSKLPAAAITLERRSANRSVVSLGGATPARLSSAEQSVKAAVVARQRQLISEMEDDKLQNFWGAVGNTGPPQPESWDHLKLRGTLLLQTLCRSDPTTFLLVTHSHLVTALDGRGTMGNASAKPLLLHCGRKPYVTAL